MEKTQTELLRLQSGSVCDPAVCWGHYIGGRHWRILNVKPLPRSFSCWHSKWWWRNFAHRTLLTEGCSGLSAKTPPFTRPQADRVWERILFLGGGACKPHLSFTVVLTGSLTWGRSCPLVAVLLNGLISSSFTPQLKPEVKSLCLSLSRVEITNEGHYGQQDLF